MKYQYPFILPVFLLVLIISCGGGSTGPKDDTPPTIEAVYPADNAVDIAVDSVICVVFSEPVDSMTIDDSSFTITPALDGIYQFRGDTVKFMPVSDMTYGIEYTVGIDTDVTDTAGNALTESYTWSFSIIEDPDDASPTVVSTSPSSGAYNTEINIPISAAFSKGIDPSTLTASSFTVSNGVTGTVSYSDNTATFTPDSDLDYSTSYTVTLTTAVADTFGINLAQNYAWSFSTRPDPSIPLVTILSPNDSAIVGETVDITVSATQPDGIDKVELYVGGMLVDSVLNPSGNVTFNWDASIWNVGEMHNIYAKAYASGYENTSQTVTLIYLWQEVAFDINDPWSTDIKRIYKRTTNTLLELRYEFWENWTFPYIYDSINDTTYYDPSLDLAIFFDTDRNRNTGSNQIGDGTLNDIGADYRVILGFHGGDTAFAKVALNNSEWIPVYDTNGFARHEVPRDTNVLELAIPWSDLDNTGMVYLLSINVNLEDGENNYKFDWVPDKGMGHTTILRRDQYVGKPVVPLKTIVRSTKEAEPRQSHRFENPFN